MGPPRGSFGDGGFGGSGGRTPNPYAPSGSGWSGGRTPNPYAAGGGKTPAWGSSKTPNPYAEGGEHHLIRVPKPQILTRRRVGERQAGAHLLGRRTPILLRIRAVVLDQDGAVQRPPGEARRRNHPPGTRVRQRRLTMGGLVQHHRHREVGSRVG